MLSHNGRGALGSAPSSPAAQSPRSFVVEQVLPQHPAPEFLSWLQRSAALLPQAQLSCLFSVSDTAGVLSIEERGHSLVLISSDV